MSDIDPYVARTRVTLTRPELLAVQAAVNEHLRDYSVKIDTKIALATALGELAAAIKRVSGGSE